MTKHSRFRIAAEVICACAILALAAGSVFAANWPQFRGPIGLGYTEDKELPLKWGGRENENVLWTAPLKGQGHASPIVWGDSVFVCTAHWPPESGAREKVMPEHHVLCYRATD